jgi:hypothetical protein
MNCDQEETAEKLGERKFPAEEDPEHDPDLEDEVRRGELERHRRPKASPLLKERLGDGDGGVTA